MQMDELLRSRGVSIRGPSAINVVLLEHVGLSVLPIADQLQGTDVNCAAAIVSNALLEGCDDSDSASNEGEDPTVCESTGSGPG